MKRLVVALLALAGVAHADEKLVPTAVAVSSTVDNVNIKPDQLIDGKMSTAWNSVTGEKNAWVAVRVPAKAHVSAIKLTAGFAAVDKKLGDLFTENIRIKHVKVARNSGWIGEFDLDVNNRELQTIKVDTDGGDFRIYVTETLPGTKKNWREIAISELEIWGTPAPVDPTAKKPKPLVVKLGDLDAGAMLSVAECKRAMGKLAGSEVEPIWVTDAVTLCRRDISVDDLSWKTELSLVDRRTKKLLTTLEPISSRNGQEAESSKGPGAEYGDYVSVELRALTTTERVIVVVTHTELAEVMNEYHGDRTQWYRASASGLVKILEWTSDDGMNEEEEGDRCDLAPFAPAASIPRQLSFDCVHITSDWHNENTDKQGKFEKKRKERYKWNGTEYVKQ